MREKGALPFLSRSATGVLSGRADCLSKWPQLSQDERVVDSFGSLRAKRVQKVRDSWRNRDLKQHSKNKTDNKQQHK